MRIGATILSLMLLIGFSVAAQTAATTAPSSAGAFSSLISPSAAVLSPGSSPQTDPPGDTLHVDLEAFNNAVGLTAGGIFYTAARLTPTVACTVGMVTFYKWDVSNDDYLFVWEAGTPTNLGAIIESVPYSGAITMAWEPVLLPIRVPLDANEDIWVGPRMNHGAGLYPLGVDDGPAVAGRGGWINYQGSWIELANVGLDMNWHIRAIPMGSGELGADVGAEAVVAPPGMVFPAPILPRVRIRNYGIYPESAIPLTCWIGIGSGHEFTSTTTYAGPLARGAHADVTFPDLWTGVNGDTYNVTMFTSLAGDERPSNDTAHATVAVQSAVWETIPKPPADIDRLAHATVYDPDNDKIYMIGGNPAGNPGTYLTDCQEYDPEAWTWDTKPPMTTPRGWLPGSFCNGKIYLIGVQDNSGAAIAVNEVFDPMANTWATLTPRPRIGLAASEAVWRDSLIYVMGGNDASSGFANVDIYDPANDAWTVGTSLPFADFMGSAAIIDDTIFIVQGYSGSACWPNLYKGVINEPDPAQITWVAGRVPLEPVFNGATATMYGDVYWLGGFINAATATNHLWKYSTWDGTITNLRLNYPVTLARLNFMCARPARQELFVLAGDEAGNWATPNHRYYRLVLEPPGVEEQHVKVGGSIDDVAPTLGRNHVRISFTVARRGNVSLDVYEAAGSLVRTLVNGTVDRGSQSVAWDGMSNSGRRVASGSYFYRLTADGRSVSSKSVLF